MTPTLSYVALPVASRERPDVTPEDHLNSHQVVELKDVTFSYPNFMLGPLTLTIHAGDRYALVGRNGAGKTTLLGILAGQRATAEGRIVFKGIERCFPDTAVKQHVAFVTSEVLGCPWMTVRAHFGFLASFYEHWSMDNANSLAQAMELPLDKPLQALSRGNALKLALCAAWGQQADLLLLDEPTAGLDPLARLELLTQLSVYLEQRSHVAIVFATHVLEDLEGLAVTHLLALREGRGRCEALERGAIVEDVRSKARRFLMEPTP